MNICHSNLCTGCSACATICPTNSIIMVEDKCGFLRPSIDNKCIDCKKCVNACPNNIIIKRSNGAKTYVGKIKDSDAIIKSASGGIGYILSKYIVENGGFVYGAVYDTNNTVKHILVDNMDNLSRLQGSKYVQSDVSDTYRQVIDILKQKRTVAYFGTPCQIAGLLAVVPKSLTMNLYTCDILCAGVPSPLAFRAYMTYLKNKMKAEMVSINFKSKKLGYSFGYLTEVEFKNKKKKMLYATDSTYIKSIGYGFVRESCHECKYKSIDRVSDISLGDYAREAKNNELGVSSILVNTEKGGNWINSIAGYIEMHPVEQQEVIDSQKGAFSYLIKKNNDYEEFFENLKMRGWNFVSDRYLTNKSVVEAIKDRIPPKIIYALRRLVK